MWCPACLEYLDLGSTGLDSMDRLRTSDLSFKPCGLIFSHTDDYGLDAVSGLLRNLGLSTSTGTGIV